MPKADASVPALAYLNSLSDEHLSKLRGLYIERNGTAAEAEKIMEGYPEFPKLE
ncbi:hypothetical protein ANO14919_092080 [Xylariales sp. No.14919]|nr:hypothetical protein ANO14919_092080 [Xylariales sp. No.14919]